MDELSKFAHIWDGSDPGWSLTKVSEITKSKSTDEGPFPALFHFRTGCPRLSIQRPTQP